MEVVHDVRVLIGPNGNGHWRSREGVLSNMHVPEAIEIGKHPMSTIYLSKLKEAARIMAISLETCQNCGDKDVEFSLKSLQQVCDMCGLGHVVLGDARTRRQANKNKRERAEKNG